MTAQSTGEPLLSVQAAAKLSRLYRGTIYRLVRSGRLGAVVIGTRAIRIPWSALVELLRARATSGVAVPRVKRLDPDYVPTPHPIPLRRNRPDRKTSTRLTAKQRERVRALYATGGLSYSQVAAKFGISKRTAVVICKHGGCPGG